MARLPGPQQEQWLAIGGQNENRGTISSKDSGRERHGYRPAEPFGPSSRRHGNLLLHGNPEVPFSACNEIGLTRGDKFSLARGISQMRYVPLTLCLVATAVFTVLLFFGQVFGFIPLAVSAGLSGLGVWDMVQPKHSPAAELSDSRQYSLCSGGGPAGNQAIFS